MSTIRTAYKIFCFTFQFVTQSVVVLLLLLSLSCAYATDDNEELYEPAEEICDKCNCTSVNEKDTTLDDGESGTLFTIDCSMKTFEHIFAKWPESMGDTDKHNGLLNFSFIKLFELNAFV